jgi:16S rRNA (guanine527-N7)-methyltransferase
MKSRLHELLLAINVKLDPCVRDQLLWYLEEMLRWNRSINLTAIKDPLEALEKHLVDSLTLVPLLQGDELVLDMGSGAGLPGIPLKIAWPTLRVLSVDSVGKKIVFQQHVVRSLALKAFKAETCRIEALAANPDYRNIFDVVTARALTHLSQLMQLAEPFIAAGGRLLAMKGPEGIKELEESVAVMEAFNFKLEKIHSMKLPISKAERTVIEIKRQL